MMVVGVAGAATSRMLLVLLWGKHLPLPSILGYLPLGEQGALWDSAVLLFWARGLLLALFSVRRFCWRIVVPIVCSRVGRGCGGVLPLSYHLLTRLVCGFCFGRLDGFLCVGGVVVL